MKKLLFLFLLCSATCYGQTVVQQQINALKATKADTASVYTKTQVVNILKDSYLRTSVATKAAATAIAVGTQARIITVAVDESDSNRTGNKYIYDGDGVALGLPLF